MGLNFDFLGKSFMQGILIHAAPGMLEGAMYEILPQVELGTFIAFVNSNANIWDILDPEQKKAFRNIGPKIGNLDWLNSDWVMEKGRMASPSLYSTIAGWPESLTWLERQIEDIKNHISGGS